MADTKTADGAKPEKLTLGEAIRDLGWFAWLFTLVVGAPSILQILQLTVPGFQLIPLLQWIPDRWAELMAVMGAIIEPLFQPAIEWINEQFDWRLVLDPIWRPLFALSMVFVLAAARSVWRERNYGEVGRNIPFGFGALIGALLAGLVPSDGGWWAQGLQTAAPVMGALLILGLIDVVIGLASGKWSSAGESIREAVFAPLVAGLFLFGMAALLSLIPGFGDAAGMVTLAGFVVSFGVVFTLAGLSQRERDATRVGLTILGGFALAGLILVTDQVVKALGAG